MGQATSQTPPNNPCKVDITTIPFKGKGTDSER